MGITSGQSGIALKLLPLPLTLIKLCGNQNAPHAMRKEEEGDALAKQAKKLCTVSVLQLRLKPDWPAATPLLERAAACYSVSGGAAWCACCRQARSCHWCESDSPSRSKLERGRRRGAPTSKQRKATTGRCTAVKSVRCAAALRPRIRCHHSAALPEQQAVRQRGTQRSAGRAQFPVQASPWQAARELCKAAEATRQAGDWPDVAPLWRAAALAFATASRAPA